MGRRKNTLWRVPLFYIIAGIAGFYLNVYILLKLAIVNLPDGTVTIDSTRALLVDGALFLGVLLIGGLVFLRDMTRREIFTSASIVVLYGVILVFAEWALSLGTGPGAIWMIYLSRPFEWCSVVPQIFLRLNGSLWLGAAARVLTPYLFVIFGKKNKRTY